MGGRNVIELPMMVNPPARCGGSAAEIGPPTVARADAAGRILEAMKQTRAASRRPFPGSPFNLPETQEPAEHYAVNDLVTHDKYGLGTVTGADDADTILVDFGLQKVRIALPCAKLFRL
jgi:hypothetical protein